MAEASWLRDPSGTHELRYWNGSTWTEHVSDHGTAGQDPLTADFPSPVDAFPPPPPAPPAAGDPAFGATSAPPATAAPVPAGKLSWKDRLKQVADQGKAMAEQGKQKVA